MSPCVCTVLTEGVCKTVCVYVCVLMCVYTEECMFMVVCVNGSIYMVCTVCVSVLFDFDTGRMILVGEMEL